MLKKISDIKTLLQCFMIVKPKNLPSPAQTLFFASEPTRTLDAAKLNPENFRRKVVPMATGLCSSGATLQVTIADISIRAATSHAPNGHNYAASATATASGGNGDDVDRGDSSDIMM